MGSHSSYLTWILCHTPCRTCNHRNHRNQTWSSFHCNNTCTCFPLKIFQIYRTLNFSCFCNHSNQTWSSFPYTGVSNHQSYIPFHNCSHHPHNRSHTLNPCKNMLLLPIHSYFFLSHNLFPTEYRRGTLDLFRQYHFVCSR